MSRRPVAPAEERWFVTYYRLWAFSGGVIALACWLAVGVWGIARGHLALGLIMVLLSVPLGIAIVRERRRILSMDGESVP